VSGPQNEYDRNLMDLAALSLALLLAAPPLASPAKPPAAKQDAKVGDPWAALRFLVGSWKADPGGGKPGKPVGGGFTFSIDLDAKVAVRHGRSEFAPRPGEARGVVHEDLTVVYPKGTALQAICWDSEGHVIRYGVRSGAGTVIFESDPGQPGPRSRLVYARRGADEVEVSFAVAPPGRDYEPHVSGLARRIRDPEPVPGAGPARAPMPPVDGK
jgi:hypothetical protein